MPSDKAIQAASKWAAETITLKDNGLAVSIATSSLARVLDKHAAEALADTMRVVDNQREEINKVIRQHIEVVEMAEKAGKMVDAWGLADGDGSFAQNIQRSEIAAYLREALAAIAKLKEGSK